MSIFPPPQIISRGLHTADLLAAFKQQQMRILSVDMFRVATCLCVCRLAYHGTNMMSNAIHVNHGSIN